MPHNVIQIVFVCFKFISIILKAIFAPILLYTSIIALENYKCMHSVIFLCFYYHPQIICSNCLAGIAWQRRPLESDLFLFSLLFTLIPKS